MRTFQRLCAGAGLYLLVLTPFFWPGALLIALGLGVWLGRRGAFAPAELGPRRPARVICLDVARRERERRRGWL